MVALAKMASALGQILLALITATLKSVLERIAAHTAKTRIVGPPALWIVTNLSQIRATLDLDFTLIPVKLFASVTFVFLLIPKQFHPRKVGTLTLPRLLYWTYRVQARKGPRLAWSFFFANRSNRRSPTDNHCGMNEIKSKSRRMNDLPPKPQPSSLFPPVSSALSVR